MHPKPRAVFFGELLMRLATKRYERFVQAREFEVGYTGAEANAAVSLARRYLEKSDRAAWYDEIEAMIGEHHSIEVEHQSGTGCRRLLNGTG